MTRQERYPDTLTFKYFNANPKNRKGGDCVIRALSTALNKSWEEVVRELTEVGIKCGFVLNDKTTYTKYLKSLGYEKKSQPRKWDNTKYTGKEFCKQIAKPNKKYIAHIGGNHIVAIVDCKVYDIWNSTDGCIGNYWEI